MVEGYAMWWADFNGKKYGNGIKLSVPLDAAIAQAIANDMMVVLGPDGTCTKQILEDANARPDR